MFDVSSKSLTNSVDPKTSVNDLPAYAPTPPANHHNQIKFVSPG